MRKFWNWVRNSDGGRTLYLDGTIAEESWYGDEITPALFRSELFGGEGECEGAPPVTIWLNSPGGDVFAAAQIYNMLMEYTGRVTVKIDGIAASAASVIAMAGGEVLMSPVSCLMIHNPSTIAIGDGEEMLRAKALLDEVKESIINAYELKSNQPRLKISRMMDAETWMNANKAVELGFADGILYTNAEPADEGEQEFAWNRARRGKNGSCMLFSRAAVTNSLLGKLPKSPAPPEQPTGTTVESLEKRLSLLSH